MALQEIWMPSPHYSTSRGPYNKIVFHTTEGAMKIRDLGAWFANPSAQCSSHHGADNYERGVFGAYVYENHKAWTQGNANDYCLSIELCAYASWSRDTWLGSKAVLVDNAAEWLAYMVARYDVPWTVLSNAQAQDPGVRGICQHVNLGSWGSGHVDCGGGFPLDVVIDKARKQGGSSASTGGTFMADVAFDSSGRPWEAGVWADNGQVNVKVGDSSWAAVDSEQSGAKGGAGIAYDPAGDRMRITYINAGGDMCAYTTAVSPIKWSWANLGGNFKG
jgi:N-acetylmuramoyl-L-alanine amidase